MLVRVKRAQEKTKGSQNITNLTFKEYELSQT